MKLLVKNLFPFFVLVFVVMGCQSQADMDARRERDRVAEVLNKQFDLRDKLREMAGRASYDCRFQFRAQYSDNKILLARLCESSPSVANISDILTSDNVAMIKGAGFAEVVLYDRHEDKVLGREVFR
jgi:hypothetical protein